MPTAHPKRTAKQQLARVPSKTPLLVPCDALPFLVKRGRCFYQPYCRGWVHQIGIEVVQILGKVVGSENSGEHIKFRETCLGLPAGWVC